MRSFALSASNLSSIDFFIHFLNMFSKIIELYFGNEYQEKDIINTRLDKAEHGNGMSMGMENTEAEGERITKKRTKNKTGLGMEKTVKDKAKSKPESQSSQKVNRKVNWSKSKSTQVNPGAKVKEI
ncbi:hypothetical protein Tco_0438822 [Tanacetum coccineum]